MSEIKQKEAEIDKLREDFLIGTDDKPSLKKRMETLEEETKVWHLKVYEFHQKLTKGSEKEGSIILQIEEAKEQALESVDDTSTAFQDSQTILKDLSNFYEKVFGKVNKEGIRVGGLKIQFDSRVKDITDFEKQQKTKYSTLITEIESLLPGATSAGLASAYKVLKDSYDAPIRNTTRMFYGSLLGLLVIGVMLVSNKIGWFYIDFIETADPKMLLGNILFKLPITIPLVWLALFASKRRSQNMRLQQEYAHKEALAKSYQGYKSQIEGLGDDENDVLLKQLLRSTIESVSFNASGTLDAKHGDKVPLIDDAEGLFKVIKAATGK